MDRWEGKVAVVTGASAGVGAAIAKKLVQNGLVVVGLARRVDKIEALSRSLNQESGKLYGVKCDITREDDVVRYFTHITNNIGPIHILINNAYLIKPANLTSGAADDWRRVFEVNVIALSICTREALKIMNEHKIAGHIINMNSTLGHFITPGTETNNVYPASKYAVTALCESLRHELRQLKSRTKVTSISPGHIRMDPEGEENTNNRPALKPDDISDAIIYVLGTGPNVQVQELIIRPLGERY